MEVDTRVGMVVVSLPEVKSSQFGTEPAVVSLGTSAALSRREMMRRMAEARLAADRTQTELGAAVGTSQAQIARIDKGDADCRISSVERYAAALGFEVKYQLVPANGARKTGKRAATQKWR
jgi:DNA-binding XRE family transcriptional regulator